MNLNNLKLALRNAFKNKLISLSKLIGISISFAVILFSAAYVYYETSFDKDVPDFDRIYRVVMHGMIEGNEENFAVSSPEMGPAAVAEIPEVTQTIRIKPVGRSMVFHQDDMIGEQVLMCADPDIFNFFGLPFRSRQANPLESESNIVISESLAINQFGSVEKAYNKMLKFRGQEYAVTGVFADLPDNFHLQFDIVQPLDVLNPDEVGWDSQSYFTYIKTAQPVNDLDDLDFKLSKIMYAYYDSEVDGAAAQSWDDLKHTENLYLFMKAEPLADIHFSQHKFDPAVTSSKTYVYGAIILSILVLIISSLNYVNLTIANLSTRLKEMGIRKTIGAFNQQIRAQFIQESLLFWSVGFGLAVVICFAAGPPMAQYLNLEISISRTEIIGIVSLAFLVLLLFNLISVIVPIGYFSRKQVLQLIKGKNNFRNRLSVKSSFVFVQFVLSALIILGAVIVNKQITYLVSKNRGYNSENVIAFNLYDLNEQKRASFLEALEGQSAVRNVATSNNYFGEDLGMSAAFFEVMEQANYFHTSMLGVDEQFFTTFDFELIKGTAFRKNRQSDFESVIINETAALEYRGEGDLIGRELILNEETFQIAGVVKDFNFRSLHHKIQPLVITRIKEGGHFYVKVTQDQVPEVLDIIEQQWVDFGIARPFTYEFHDQVLAAHYAKDQNARKLLLILSLISVIIACIGLYAISYFIIIRKTKEIGIRKVNGANFRQILLMLNRNFSQWVLLAFLLSSPIAWFLMDRWLQNFAYRTTLSWWIFAGAGAAMMLIALVTVSWQSWRAARRNPVEALRYE